MNKGLLLFAFSVTNVVYGASEVDYEAERKASTALKAYINVDEAYTLGYTGKGVTVAVYGTQIKKDHPELEGKVSNLSTYKDDYDYSSNNGHETWVAGVIAAARDGIGMHGIAYDADIFNLRYPGGLLVSGLASYLEENNIRIFNQSSTALSTTKVPSLVEDINKKVSDSSKNVYVFSAGNNSTNTSSYESQSPAYFGTGQYANIINAGALSSADLGYENGKITSNVDVLSISNLAGNAALWTIFAPGSGIYTTDAASNGYTSVLGTSFSAPVISSALALVLEAYPWLTGKQLADAILTTATTDFTYDTTSSRFANLTQAQIFGRGILNVGAAVQGIALLDADRMTSDNVMTITELKDTASQTQALEIFDTQGHNGEFANDIASSAWEEEYHTSEKSTESAAKADSAALKGIELIGLLKQGDGTLTLSGDNTYTGATVIDGGVINVSKRTKTTSAGDAGSGGIIRGSGVVIRDGGTLTGNGSIYTNVVNNGTLISSYLNGGGLSVKSISGSGTYIINLMEGLDTASSGALIIDSSLGADDKNPAKNVASISYESDSTIPSTATIASTKSTLSGNLVVTYGISNSFDGTYVANSTILTTSMPFLSVAEGTDVDVNFDSISVNVDSPTLTATVTNADINEDYTFDITLSHANDAYSKYASNKNEVEVGNAMAAISRVASSDSNISTLLAALDWSNPDGSAITSALGYIANSTEIFYVNSYLSLKQQSSFNTTIITQMLAKRQNFDKSTFWVIPYGGYDMRRGENNLSEFDAWSAGVLGGIDGYIGEDSILGMHIGIGNITNRMNIGDEGNVFGAYGGIHGKFQIGKMFYLMGLSRVGVENATTDRNLYIEGVDYNNDTNFTNLVLGEMLGFGVDFGINDDFDIGLVAFGEYSYLMRLSGKEEKTTKTALLLSDKKNYQSLNGLVGTKIAIAYSDMEAFDLYVLYRHEFLDVNIKDRAYFSGYNDYSIIVNSVLKDKDSLVLQANLRIFGGSDGFIDLMLGGEASSSSLTFNGSLQFKMKF